MISLEFVINVSKLLTLEMFKVMHVLTLNMMRCRIIKQTILWYVLLLREGMDLLIWSRFQIQQELF